MSKQGKRKITVEIPKTKDLANRPSVFERLGTKKTSAKKTSEHCRQWAQHGSCAYGKSCKFAATHTLISPSKQRAANKDSEQKRLVKDDAKSRLHSAVVVRSGRSPDGEIDNWDQNDLECVDTDELEKRRLQLQRELELQLKMESGKDMRKEKKKPVSSSSSSRSSSSSSVSSSSSDGSSSSSSSGREVRRKTKKGKLKRNSSSSSDGDAPAKKKIVKSDSKRDRSETKKTSVKKDDRLLKKSDVTKKKPLSKTALGKKSLSPGKKSGGTPPISSKSLSKAVGKHGKSPAKRDKKSASPHSSKDREKDKKEKDRDKDREKEREKERERRGGRSRSPRKGRSRSPRHPKDPRRKESSERSRPVSPKKQVRREGSTDRHRKRSPSRDRDRGRDHKDRSLERRKEKHDDKDRHDRKDRGRERNKEGSKRDDGKRRGRDRGLGSRGPDKGLEKPNKPMERLLPRPEERLAALAAISNRALETDKNSTTSKDRQDTHSERGGRKQDRLERDRSSKRDRIGSLDREGGDYEMGMDRNYDHGMDQYERMDDRYDDGPRDDERSPGYARDRHYDPGYDISGPPRGYPEDEDRMYADRMGDHRGVDMGYDDRRPHRDHSWEGRSGSMDRERYMHQHKEWDSEDYRGGDWGRDRHWPMHEPQMNDWGDKDADIEGWHHRGHPTGPHRGRMHDDYNRGMRMDMRDKRRPQRTEPEAGAKEAAGAAPRDADADDKPVPVPDDLSEISDDPDDILNREDMIDPSMDEDSQAAQMDENVKPDGSEKESTQDTSGAGDEKESQGAKNDEDVTDLDFEEISDGELEEERTRAGLGDALGVDWASLVADVHRREQTAPTGGARDRWKPERVLARLGLSVHMAGKDTVQDILNKNAESLLTEKTSKDEPCSEHPPENTPGQNGKHEEDEKPALPPDVESLHPVAAIQVAIEKRKRQRAVLFGSGCEITRALSARRDLALRRHLCQLPAAERPAHARAAPAPRLFHAARAAFMQPSLTG
ncbi:zinc finger CCCH domain-containing protein 13-like [Cydia pomonella]|uniref:zinc finger CCCH domain-containing protein 13-like n=1 Tax=Cydia pomonella TaxID=82600 RepID=UPI002ADD86B6|nr:zinc finger CCCH domain-containing protein 13-like [Cydia pomonella]